MKRIFLLLICILTYVFSGCNKNAALSASASPELENKNMTGNLAAAAITAPSAIAGVNWADPGDNFQNGNVVPSGLTSSDSYATVEAKTSSIIAGFQKNMPNVNTLRLPINPPTVSGSWWAGYTGAIDEATSKGMNVILGCWEAANSKDGLVDNTTLFYQMWDKVVAKYSSNTRVFFEVFNEPHGYSLSDLGTLYNTWLTRYPNVTRARVLLGGTGYSQDINALGADSRFNGCNFSVHDYGFWFKTYTTTAQWENSWRVHIGAYASRAIATEWGATMTTGKNYDGAINGDYEIAYIQGSSDVFRSDHIGSVYWPGLRDGDTFSMQKRGGTGNNITLTTTNQSGVDRVELGWGH